MAGATEAGDDLEVGRVNQSEVRTQLRAKTGDPSGYLADFVLKIDVGGDGWLLTMPPRGIDGIVSVGSVGTDATSGTLAGPLPAGNGVVCHGANGLVGYVHSAPRDKGLEEDSQVGVLGGGNNEHSGGMGRGRNGVVGVSAEDDGIGVNGRCDLFNGVGVSGESTSGVGVLGKSQGNDGIVGVSDSSGRSGVHGRNSAREGKSFGVFGTCGSRQGAGVFGTNDSSGDAVLGSSRHGGGVRGASENNDGVCGHANVIGKSGVYGEKMWTTGLLTAVSAELPKDLVVQLHPTNKVFGVTGRADGPTGIGVQGLSESGIGIWGAGGTYGAHLEGERAALRL